MSELSLGEALRAYLRHSPFRHKMNEYHVQALWEKEMGTTISRYTDSVKLIGDRMNEVLGERLIDEVIIK